ncbi:MAG: exodeoxyribonuclease III [Proteobacteria bacterium]|nr:exodeoxyribonuclease III [Pseudomonadota bacterium]
MRMVSWNVNGIRAAVKKGFASTLDSLKTDLICLQETKAQDDQVVEALKEIKDFHIYSNSAVKKGYSGTAILSREKPLSVRLDMGIEEHDQEGRITALEFNNFFLITVYTPNSGSGLKRLEYRQRWDIDFLDYLRELEKEKPIVVCGDLNVAHKEIDLARPKPNYNKTAGYTQKEIDGMDNVVAASFIDTFRFKNPDVVKYSWWSYRAGAREKNIGWRLDYFLCSKSLLDNIEEVDILNDVHGSDHCPVLLDLNFDDKISCQ